MISKWQNHKGILLLNLLVIPEKQHKQDLFGADDVVVRNMVGDECRLIAIINRVAPIFGCVEIGTSILDVPSTEYLLIGFLSIS